MSISRLPAPDGPKPGFGGPSKRTQVMPSRVRPQPGQPTVSKLARTLSTHAERTSDLAEVFIMTGPESEVPPHHGGFSQWEIRETGFDRRAE